MIKTEGRSVMEHAAYVVAGVCDGCGAYLEPMNKGAKFASGCPMPIFSGAVRLTIRGGYGAYFDDGDVHADLCSKCCDALSTWFPSIKIKE